MGIWHRAERLTVDQEALVRSPDTEDEYLSWVLGNPHGFVINANKAPSQMPDHMQGMTWHHANCSTIDPKRHKRLVSGATMKACSLNPAPLAIWAVERGETLQYCAVCCRNWHSTPSPQD